MLFSPSFRDLKIRSSGRTVQGSDSERRRMFATNRFVTSACSGQYVTSRLRSITSWHMFVTINVSVNTCLCLCLFTLVQMKIKGYATRLSWILTFSFDFIMSHVPVNPFSELFFTRLITKDSYLLNFFFLHRLVCRNCMSVEIGTSFVEDTAAKSIVVLSTLRSWSISLFLWSWESTAT